jgi:hypothetical protein
MKTYWGVEVYIHAFLTSALDGSGQLHAPEDLPARKEPWPTHPPIQWVPGALSLGREAGHLPPSSAEVKE